MYSTSATFQAKIKDKIRVFHWGGTINTPVPITLKDKNFFSGSLTRAISGQALEIGSVYSSQLSLELDLAGVSRYELYDKTISLDVKLDGATDVVPMGVFTITEALQSASKITITAFDDMIKFDDVKFAPTDNTSVQLPYKWLSDACSACGVTLGSTSADIQSLPNGNRKTGFADAVTDVQTWRDVLGYIGAYLGAYAYIGRDGLLYMGVYGANSVDTVPANFRCSSNLSDFRTTYDGLYATYKDGGVQEYVSNSNSGGIVLDLGVNPFLQFSNDQNREDAIQEIIDLWNGVYYVPYEAEMPLIPTYDTGDVLTFVDNQASIYDLGAITEITYNVGGTMSVTCSGDNPRLTEAQDRFTKTLEGLSSEYSNGMETGSKSFWLLESHIIANNNIGGTKTLVAQIDFNQKTDVQRMGFMFDCDGTLSASAVVTIEITVDDELAYTQEYTDRKLKGKRDFPANTGFRVTGKGSHTAKVYMTVTDSPLLWSELA